VNHRIAVERFGVRLRPVELSDARFIYELRRSPELSRYIGELNEDFDRHQSWLEDYMHREGDYYFCIETLAGQRIGTISVYDIAAGTGNWGRWIISPGYPAAPASVWLIFHVAFDILGLSGVYSNTVIDNAGVVSFHDRCGLVRKGVERGGLTIKGVSYDMIIHSAGKEDWPAIRKKLERPAAMAERFLLEGVEG
jgi:Acetyltransferases, including N-acetylases of ribosomal proteins